MSVLFPAGSSRVSLGEGGTSRFNAALPTLDFSKMTFSAAPAQPFQFYPAEVMPSSSLPGGDEQEPPMAGTTTTSKRHSQFVQSSSYHYETDGGYNKQTGAASTAQPSSSATSSNSGDDVGDFGKMNFAAVDVSKGLWQLPSAGVEEFKEVQK